MEEKSFKEKYQIIRQGDKGIAFYIIADGRVVVSRKADPNALPEIVKVIEEGEVFGERSLLLNELQKASFTAETYTKCLILDVQSFHRLLGSLKPFLLSRIKFEEEKLK